jgi:hypothetical protein
MCSSDVWGYRLGTPQGGGGIGSRVAALAGAEGAGGDGGDAVAGTGLGLLLLLLQKLFLLLPPLSRRGGGWLIIFDVLLPPQLAYKSSDLKLLLTQLLLEEAGAILGIAPWVVFGARSAP